MFLYLSILALVKGKYFIFHTDSFQYNVTVNSNILMWFTMASLDLTTETECEDP